MKGLTGRQAEILQFVTDYIKKNNCPPTIRETGTNFNISVRAVQDHFTALEKKGYLTKVGKQSRSIRVVDTEEEQDVSQKVPLLGTISTGKPIFCQENCERMITLSSPFIKPHNNYFALRVRGDSMIDAGINPNDIILIQQQESAEDKQIVVALIGENITVKRYFKESNRVRLQPENPKYQPIYSTEVQILGVLTHVIREYE